MCEVMPVFQDMVKPVEQEAEEHGSSESARVECWREEVLVKAGYPVIVARAIAHELDVDLHVAVALVEQGCSPGMAMEILL